MYVTFKKFHEATVFENKIVDFFTHVGRSDHLVYLSSLQFFFQSLS